MTQSEVFFFVSEIGTASRPAMTYLLKADLMSFGQKLQKKRHATFLQTSTTRSLQHVFWRYSWQKLLFFFFFYIIGLAVYRCYM